MRNRPTLLEQVSQAMRRLEETLSHRADLQSLLHDLAISQEELAIQQSYLEEANRLLEDSRNRYAQLFDFAPFAYVALDPNGVVLEINLTGVALLGLPRSRIEGTPFLNRVAAPDRPGFLDHMRRCRQGEETVVTELRLAPGGPDAPIVELYSRPAPDAEAGRSFWTVLGDVTSKKRMEEALRSSEQRMTAAVEASGAGVFEHAIPIEDGAYQSERWAEILGFRLEELPPPDRMKRWLLERIHPDDRKRFIRAYQDLGEGRANGYRLEVRIQREDGEWIWVRVLAKAVTRDHRGRCRRVAGVLLDITSEKQRALENEQRVSQLRALAAELFAVEERERRKLASDLHDDLAQILVAARMRVDLLSANEGDARAEGALKEVADLLSRADRSVRNVISQASPPILHDLGLVPALERLAGELEKQYAFRITVESDEPLLRVDDNIRFMLFRSVSELLVNAAKHSGADAARVRFSFHPEDRLCIVVEDRGRGFDPGKLDGRSEEGTGEGFGLFSIRERLEPIGGSFKLESAPGKGTRAAIYVPVGPDLPVAAPPGAEELKAPSQPAAEAAPGAPGPQKIRVLLADDHQVVRSALASMLADEPDIEVVGEASDGEAAVDLAQRLPIDVIIMDVAMPRLNGIEATRRLVEALPHVRIIGLSMHEGDHMGRAMCQAGAATYLTKSVPAHSLVSTIRSVYVTDPRRPA